MKYLITKIEAQDFQKWICYEVIPSIRSTGQYTLNQGTPTVAGFLHTLVDTIFGVKNTVDEHTLTLEDHNIRFTRQDQILMEYNGRISEVEEAQKAVFETEYWSILGFANYYRLDPNTYNSVELGKKASKYCRENNIAIGYRPDQNYGRVNIYPYHVLVEIFNNTFSGNWSRPIRILNIRMGKNTPMLIQSIQGVLKSTMYKINHTIPSHYEGMGK